MGFLDKLLGRSKGTAGDVADMSKDRPAPSRTKRTP